MSDRVLGSGPPLTFFNELINNIGVSVDALAAGADAYQQYAEIIGVSNVGNIGALRAQGVLRNINDRLQSTTSGGGSGGRATDPDAERRKELQDTFNFAFGQLRRKEFGSDQFLGQQARIEGLLPELETLLSGREFVVLTQRFDDFLRSARDRAAAEEKREAERKAREEEAAETRRKQLQLTERRDAFSLQLSNLSQTTDASSAERFRSSLLRRQEAIFDLTPQQETLFARELAFRSINDRVDARIEQIRKEAEREATTPTTTTTTRTPGISTTCLLYTSPSPRDS